MPRKRKKPSIRPIRLSDGPLPPRYAGRFDGRLLVFSDASLKRHGGLAAVLFDGDEEAPRVGTRSVPAAGSNELELQAALFGLAQARAHFPGRSLALFADNQDAVLRLERAKALGLAQDPALGGMWTALGCDEDLAEALADAALCWVKGHGKCRGNALADAHAATASG